MRHSNGVKPKKTLTETLAANLSDLMDRDADLNTVQKVSVRSGVGRGTVDRVRKAELATSLDNVEKLASAFGRDPVELLSPKLEYEPQSAPPPGYVRLHLLDAPHGLGKEMAPVDYPEVLRHVDVLEMWLRSQFPANPVNIKIVPAVGDSMSPTIEDGSQVFVDTSVRQYVGDGLYSIVWEGRVQIKRIQAMHAEKLIKILSDNKFYDPGLTKEEDLIITGKALGTWNFKRF